MFNFEEYIRENEDTWEYKAEKLKLDFAIELDQILRTQKISNAELADKLDTSRAYVTKVLRGDTNLTIESIAKLCHAVDKQFCFKIAEKEAEGKWLEIIRTRNFVSDKFHKVHLSNFGNNGIEMTYDAA